MPYTDFFKVQLRSDAAEYLKWYVLVMPVYKDGFLSKYVELGVRGLSLENWKNK